MPDHIRIAHPGYSCDGIEDGAPLPSDMLEAASITREEEERLGIPLDKIPLKLSNFPCPSAMAVDAGSSGGTKRNRLTGGASFSAPPAKRSRKQ